MVQTLRKTLKGIRREINRLGRDGWGSDDLAYLLDDTKTTRANYYFDIALVGLILLSCALYIVLTYVGDGLWFWILFGLEVVLMVFFTLEYVLRIHYEKKHSDYLFSWYGIADALAIIPFWLSLFVPWFWSFEFLRILRVFKLYRFFQKYLKSKVVSTKISAQIVITKMIFTMGALLFISSGFIYTFEAPNNPNINTFDDAVYFSLVTITTVGFGDITQNLQWVGWW